jgi:hypothetical protein
MLSFLVGAEIADGGWALTGFYFATCAANVDSQSANNLHGIL